TADRALCRARSPRELRPRRGRRRPALPGRRPPRRIRRALMVSSELGPLEGTIAKLTARTPDKLYVTDTPRRQERLEDELERQLARIDSDYEDDAAWYLQEHVFEADGDEIVVTDAYPRNAGMASGFRQALKALRLPSGATVYYDSGEWEPERIRAVSA